MAMFAAAYVVVWLAVALYVMRLGVRQHQLQRAVARMTDKREARSEQSEGRQQRFTDAA